MSMTIEASARTPPAKWLGAALLALALWLTGVSAATLALDPSEVVVFGPERQAIAAASRTGAAILEIRGPVVRMRSDERGLARSLYANGAWLVWPSMKGGCLDWLGNRASDQSGEG